MKQIQGTMSRNKISIQKAISTEVMNHSFPAPARKAKVIRVMAVGIEGGLLFQRIGALTKNICL